jgi:hypothetical protein
MQNILTIAAIYSEILPIRSDPTGPAGEALTWAAYALLLVGSFLILYSMISIKSQVRARKKAVKEESLSKLENRPQIKSVLQIPDTFCMQCGKRMPSLRDTCPYCGTPAG